jgi:hypothetical protein
LSSRGSLSQSVPIKPGSDILDAVPSLVEVVSKRCSLLLRRLRLSFLPPRTPTPTRQPVTYPARWADRPSTRLPSLSPSTRQLGHSFLFCSYRPSSSRRLLSWSHPGKGIDCCAFFPRNRSPRPASRSQAFPSTACSCALPRPPVLPARRQHLPILDISRRCRRATRLSSTTCLPQPQNPSCRRCKLPRRRPSLQRLWKYLCQPVFRP